MILYIHHQFTYLLTFFMVLISSSFASMIKDDSNYDPLSQMAKLHVAPKDLDKRIKNLSFRLNHLSFSEPSPLQSQILTLFNEFNSIQASELEWENLAKNYNFERWPAQNTWQEVVGASIFFPNGLLDQWLEIPETSHLVERADMLWRYAIATYLKHPLAAFYLAKSFFKLIYLQDDIEDEETPKDRCKQKAEQFLLLAFEDLQLSKALYKGQPDVTFAIGEALSEPSLSPIRTQLQELIGNIDDNFCFIKGSEQESITQGKYSKNKLSLLINWRRFKKYVTPPLQEFLDLAYKGYLPAYIAAYQYACETSVPEPEKILMQAVDKGYSSALLYLGEEYVKRNNIEIARNYYNDAIKAGFFQGYLRLAALVLDKSSTPQGQLQKLTSAQRHHLTEIYQLSAHPQNPEGFLRLGNHLNLLATRFSSKDSEEQKTFFRQAFQAWFTGFQLGNIACFEKAKNFIQEESKLILIDYDYVKYLNDMDLMLYEKLINLIHNFIIEN